MEYFNHNIHQRSTKQCILQETIYSGKKKNKKTKKQRQNKRKENKETQNPTIKPVKLIWVLLLTNKSDYHPKRTYRATEVEHLGLELDVTSSTTRHVALSLYPPSSLCSLNHLHSCNSV